MKTFYTIARKDDKGKDVYLQEDGSFSNTLDKVMLYEFEREMPPLEEGEYSTRIFQDELDKSIKQFFHKEWS